MLRLDGFCPAPICLSCSPDLGMQLRYPLASPEVVWEWAVSHVMKHWETKVECVVLGKKEWRSEVSMGFQDCTGSWKLALGYRGRGFCKEARGN